MNADLWNRVVECYHAVMEKPAHLRAEFLVQACASDPDLRREVDSLLAHEGKADKLLESPAWDHVTPPDETRTMRQLALAAGSMVAEYRIEGRLGAGGMGEVYRATDTRLGRQVALKVLAAEFARDSAWMSRFEREARLLASLNHPNIAAIYGLEESGGIRAIAMELVEGPTLAERMGRVRIPIPEALAISQQIIEALEYAHDKGIVHRDLKPANVKLRTDGVVKVLDFGLAKDVHPQVAATETATRAGVIMGTPAYMAPEQAGGLPVDRRADIWAFGVVLFEMLAGCQVYARRTTAETLAAVVRDDPPWEQLPAETNLTILRLLRRCLERDSKRRLRDIGEARIVLENPESAVDTPLVAPPRRHLHPAWMATGVLAAALAVLAILHFRETPAEPPLVRFSIPLPSQTRMGVSGGIASGPGMMAASPDGRRIAFTAVSPDGKGRIWIRALDAAQAQPLPGVEDANNPFWSPDGRQIAFWADGKLRKIDSNGGTPVTLCDSFDMRGGSWNQDGVILFAPAHTSPLFRVAAKGGECTQVTRLETTGGAAHRYPWFLPDGRHFLFMVSPSGRAPDHVSIWTGSLDSPAAKRLLDADTNAIYSQGYLLFVRENTLLAQRFDAGRPALVGEAVPVAPDIRSATTAAREIVSVSGNGLLVYESGAQGMRQLTWFDRDGNRLSTVGEPGRIAEVDLSPDRRSAAVVLTQRGNTDIWVYDLARGQPTRLTFDAAEDRDPVWSPDGRTIAFASNRKGRFDLYWKPSNGSAAEELLYADDHDKLLTTWSPDGKFLLFGGGTGMWLLPVSARPPVATSKPLPVTLDSGRARQFSPNGGWITYSSAESGRSEIYLLPFRRSGASPDARQQISRAGGLYPRWRPDGKEIFFVGSDGTFMSVGVNQKSDTVEIGEVRRLGRIVLANGYFYDVSADGQRLLVAVPLERPDEPLTVIQNWTAGLRK